MKRRLLFVLLPLGSILVASLLCWVLAKRTIEADFRAQTNRATAELLGLVHTKYPELDTAELIQLLDNNPSSSAYIASGEQVLESYGFLPEDYVTSKAAHTSFTLELVVIGLLSGSAILAAIYFWRRDVHREREVLRLVDYLQELKERTYDLRLAQNSEDEMSLLTNEIYKLTVLLKEAAELNRAQRQNLETALADISHQLRTPLTSLRVMVDNIYEAPEMPLEVRQDFIRSISQQLDSMSTLTTTLLHLARFDNHSIKLHRHTVRISDLLEQVEQNLAVLADLNDVELVFEGDLQAKASLDARWQTEALSNIVKNCIEHSQAGSKVLVRCSDCPLFLRLTVQDFGEGISPEDRRHIFERFYRAKNSHKDSIGIGLSFAKVIIEADNGQISVRTAVGKGTTFTITYFK